MFHAILFWLSIVLIVIFVILAIDAWRRKMLPALAASITGVAALCTMTFMEPSLFKYLLQTIGMIAAHFLWKHARWVEATRPNN